MIKSLEDNDEKLLKLITVIKQKGINVEKLLENKNEDNNDSFMDEFTKKIQITTNKF